MANSDSIKSLKVRFHSLVGQLVTLELMRVCKKVLCSFSAAVLQNQVFPGHRRRLYRDSIPQHERCRSRSDGSAAGFKNPGYAGEKQDSQKGP